MQKHPAVVATRNLLLICSGLAVYRAWRVDQQVGEYTQCLHCFVLPALASDAILLVAISLLLVAVAYAQRIALRLLGMLATAALALAMAVDTALWSMLSQRFHLTDALMMIGAMGSGWTQVTFEWWSPGGALRWIVGLFLILVVAGLFRQLSVRSGSARIPLLMALAWLVVVVAGHHSLAYVHEDLIGNVVEINWRQGRQQPYSTGTLSRASQRVAALAESCTESGTLRPNVIVVLAESLSAWHSGLLGGPAEWTPELDAIARSNHYATRFYANGFTTSGGEIAVIAGVAPLYHPGAVYGAYDVSMSRGLALPAMAHARGYRAQFFTNSDNNFLDVGVWLRKMGFDEVEDNEADFYKGMKRYGFAAPEDRALFDRYLTWLDERKPDAVPHLSLLMTATGHPPFLDPIRGDFNEERNVRYVDAQIGRFHRELESRGFFRDGILLILGDHRAMTPLRREEIQIHGDRAFARIPLIVSGAVDMPAVVDEAFQQSDLLPSLAELLGGRNCRNIFQGSLLRPDPQPARYVLHVRGDDRNRVDVYSGVNGLAAYRLDGDASEWMTSPPPDADDVAAWIIALRGEEPESTGVPTVH